MKTKKYIYPTRFSSLPALGYWEIDGAPVSSEEAMNGLHPKAVWIPTEISDNIHEHTRHFEEIWDEDSE